jgi:hypothetical protein
VHICVQIFGKFFKKCELNEPHYSDSAPESQDEKRYFDFCPRQSVCPRLIVPGSEARLRLVQQLPSHDASGSASDVRGRQYLDSKRKKRLDRLPLQRMIAVVMRLAYDPLYLQVHLASGQSAKAHSEASFLKNTPRYSS